VRQIGLRVPAQVLENPLDTGDAAKRAETAGSSMLAMTRSFPPQRRQSAMSIQASEATPKVAKADNAYKRPL
jgi:hypothetical protein